MQAQAQACIVDTDLLDFHCNNMDLEVMMEGSQGTTCPWLEDLLRNELSKDELSEYLKLAEIMLVIPVGSISNERLQLHTYSEIRPQEQVEYFALELRNEAQKEQLQASQPSSNENYGCHCKLKGSRNVEQAGVVVSHSTVAAMN